MLQRGQIFLTPIGTIPRTATQALPSETSLFRQALSARAFWDGEEVIRPIVRHLATGDCECSWRYPHSFSCICICSALCSNCCFMKWAGVAARRRIGEGDNSPPRTTRFVLSRNAPPPSAPHPQVSSGSCSCRVYVQRNIKLAETEDALQAAAPALPRSSLRGSCIPHGYAASRGVS
jgi:hypothetical protein